MFKKIGSFISERLSLFVGIGIIVAGHWSWLKLQNVPYLVSDAERKELPLLTAAKAIKRKVLAPFTKSDNEPDKSSTE
ncbi:hypothetical protein RN001_000757 [Aquatica leii]|uniref:Uncharacterized protein n=1 Tax=Aquatica leii TaxID=1421715 RepID=A0AAN7PKI4_9COLE|nr:hypothetical protein RN001_000757 [Aquatica leii]